MIFTDAFSDPDTSSGGTGGIFADRDNFTNRVRRVDSIFESHAPTPAITHFGSPSIIFGIELTAV